tara:strand:+ start:200 stop:1720 length:1521 start_codon:yes stop_codon:yes gene_type:complete
MDEEQFKQLLKSIGLSRILMPETRDMQNIGSLLNKDRIAAIQALPEEQRNAVLGRLYASYPEQKELISERMSESRRLLDQSPLEGRETGGVYVANNILEHATRGFDKAVALRERNKARTELEEVAKNKERARRNIFFPEDSTPETLTPENSTPELNTLPVDGNTNTNTNTSNFICSSGTNYSGLANAVRNFGRNNLGFNLKPSGTNFLYNKQLPVDPNTGNQPPVANTLPVDPNMGNQTNADKAFRKTFKTSGGMAAMQARRNARARERAAERGRLKEPKIEKLDVYNTPIIETVDPKMVDPKMVDPNTNILDKLEFDKREDFYTNRNNSYESPKKGDGMTDFKNILDETGRSISSDMNDIYQQRLDRANIVAPFVKKHVQGFGKFVGDIPSKVGNSLLNLPETVADEFPLNAKNRAVYGQVADDIANTDLFKQLSASSQGNTMPTQSNFSMNNNSSYSSGSNDIDRKQQLLNDYGSTEQMETIANSSPGDFQKYAAELLRKRRGY